MDNQLKQFAKLQDTMTLDDLQVYIDQMMELRGFKNQPLEQSLLLLVEEIGELAKAIRKDQTNMRIDKTKINNYDSIDSELADVFIVFMAICNRLNIRLYDAVYQKESINIKRVWQ